MSQEEKLKEAMNRAEEAYSNVMKRWTKAYDKFKELDDMKIEAEQFLLDIRDKIEQDAMEEGTFHDQMVFDFNIDKYGKNKMFLEEKREHSVNWDRCSCNIQCPKCKKYNVKMEYKLMRNTFGGDRVLFDIKPMLGRKVGSYFYCMDCYKVVNNDK